MPNLAHPGHLPNLRPGKEPLPRDWLPRQRRGVTPQMIGRYPDYDVLESSDTWDAATRRAVLARLAPHGPLRFFTADEEPTLRAFCDVATAQDAEPRIPVAEMVDEKLAAGKLDGFRHAGMPDDRDTWRLVLRGLDQAAAARAGAPSFARCPEGPRAEIMDALEAGTLEAPSLEGLDGGLAWSVCMRMILAAFYAHPWAWNEIGFGGPAYPRGFMRMGPLGTREPFERPGATDEDPVRVAGDAGA
jgi:gluconate 2-dehydrogenase subunit 3-like protein